MVEGNLDQTECCNIISHKLVNSESDFKLRVLLTALHNWVAGRRSQWFQVRETGEKSIKLYKNLQLLYVLIINHDNQRGSWPWVLILNCWSYLVFDQATRCENPSIFQSQKNLCLQKIVHSINNGEKPRIYKVDIRTGTRMAPQ